MASRHAIQVAARPADVYQAARETDLWRPPLVRLLIGLRAIPARFAGTGRLAFTEVAEAPGEEFVLGITGRFWTPTGGVIAAAADSFRRPPPAGLAQAVWNFSVRPSGAGAELSTETRVRCGDAETRRQFGRYWRIVRLGSGLIRTSMLRHIRTRAEASIPLLSP